MVVWTFARSSLSSKHVPSCGCSWNWSCTFRYAVPFLISIVVLVVSACGTGSGEGPTGVHPSASPSTPRFLFTDQTHLSWLSWQQQADGSLSGEWEALVFVAPVTGTTTPLVSQMAITGSLHTHTLSVFAGALALHGQLHGSSLSLSVQDSATGTTKIQLWVAVSSSLVSALVPLFQTALELEGALADLSQVVHAVPLDSDPRPVEEVVQQARRYLALVLGKWTVLRRSTSACTGLPSFLQYYPASAATFTFSADPLHSTLATRVTAVQTLWQHLLSVHLSPLPIGLHLPWLLSSDQIAATLLPAEQQLTAFAETVAQARQTMNTLRLSYQQLGQGVQRLERSCHISPIVVG